MPRQFSCPNHQRTIPPSPFSMSFFANRRELFSQSTTVVAQIGSFLLWLASLADLPVSSVISTLKLFPLKPKKYTLNAEFRKMYLKNNLNEKVFTVQPENIVLTERGGQTVKIIDFGTALQLRKGEKVLFAICECFSNFFFKGAGNGWHRWICCSWGWFSSRICIKVIDNLIWYRALIQSYSKKKKKKKVIPMIQYLDWIIS